MQTIVFLGSNKSGTSREALRISTEMGYFTVLITDRKEFLKQKEEFPEVSQMMYVETILDKEKIVAILKDISQDLKPICAVISFIDPFVSFAAMLSEEIGLTSLSTNALSIMEEKTKFRTRLKNLPTSPVYHVIQNNLTEQEYIEQYKHQLPLILKTPVSNGSKDVLLAKTIQEFKNSLHYFEKKFPGVPVLMEEYLEGTQYLIEVIVYKKRISIVAVIEQEILHSERFIITGYVYPAVLKEAEYENLQTAVTSIINELGLMNGNCHLEMRNSNGQWKLIEINPRMSGGAMNRIIQEGTGINLVKETIKLYLGEKPIVEKTEMNHVYAKFLTINTKGRLVKVTGKNRASNYEGVKEVYVKPKKGAILTKPYSLGNRYAYVIAASSTAEQAKDAALKAAREIKFYLEPL